MIKLKYTLIFRFVFYTKLEIKLILNTGVAWLSSVRFVKSQVKSVNGRNPYC